MILTLDLGTSRTKAVLWDDGGPVAAAASPIATTHPAPGLAEQDPDAWWASVVAAVGALRAQAGADRLRPDVVALCSARETFALFDDAGRALTPAIVWSDRRATDEADALVAGDGGPDAARRRRGVVLDGTTPAAKLRWLERHAPEAVARARWVLGPRDAVLFRLTGEVATDPTLASRTGWYAPSGEVLDGAPLALLPPVVPSATVAGGVTPDAAAALGIGRADVVVGAGDRACEVLGTAASAASPMVSWGTTANVSVPFEDAPDPIPAPAAVSGGALGGHLVECGLSAAGQVLEWLAQVTGRTSDDLLALAGAVPAGARGVVATAWLNGARAPWWDPGARASVGGLSPAAGAGEVARAFMESVAFDVRRCLEAVAPGRERIAAGGSGAGAGPWAGILAAVTGLPVERRRGELAASAGALVIAGEAVAHPVDVDRANPVIDVVVPDPATAGCYADLRPSADAWAAAVIGVEKAR